MKPPLRRFLVQLAVRVGLTLLLVTLLALNHWR